MKKTSAGHEQPPPSTLGWTRWGWTTATRSAARWGAPGRPTPPYSPGQVSLTQKIQLTTNKNLGAKKSYPLLGIRGSYLAYWGTLLASLFFLGCALCRPVYRFLTYSYIRVSKYWSWSPNPHTNPPKPIWAVSVANVQTVFGIWGGRSGSELQTNAAENILKSFFSGTQNI